MARPERVYHNIGPALDGDHPTRVLDIPGDYGGLHGGDHLPPALPGQPTIWERVLRPFESSARIVLLELGAGLDRLRHEAPESQHAIIRIHQPGIAALLHPAPDRVVVCWLLCSAVGYP
jgi:hypothetical protein